MPDQDLRGLNRFSIALAAQFFTLLKSCSLKLLQAFAARKLEKSLFPTYNLSFLALIE
ncbi:hypothetical protein [Methanosarcina sp. MSH10X1]|uniref:hypothetical protein n=1 Tax=Methanosarcina sp. MSH10X1 TaxID=2507075 RepID=UPI0013E2EDC6|nr:hypothetical protein [Methanosarcina sp. MSH10X1]